VTPPKPQEASLAGLPPAIDLPAGDATDPIAVGKIISPPGAVWKLVLAGGDTAFKNSRLLVRKLVLQEKDAGSDKASWQVTLSETKAGTESAHEAAKFFREGDSLKFQWLADAPELATGTLGYCVLSVQVGETKKTVGLMKPKVVKPLTIDLQKPMVHCSVDLGEMPQGKLRLEIVRVEGPKDFDKNFTADLPKPLPLRSKQGSLGLTMKTHPNNKVEFPLAFLPKGTTGVDVSLKVPPPIVAACKNPPPDIPAAKKELQKKAADAHGQIDKGKTPREKATAMAQAATYDNLMALLEFFDGVHNQVKVHFRVCLEAGDKQPIVLAATEGAEIKEKPKPK
jgi:hypothetical protein